MGQPGLRKAGFGKSSFAKSDGVNPVCAKRDWAKKVFEKWELGFPVYTELNWGNTVSQSGMGQPSLRKAGFGKPGFAKSDGVNLVCAKRDWAKKVFAKRESGFPVYAEPDCGNPVSQSGIVQPGLCKVRQKIEGWA